LTLSDLVPKPSPRPVYIEVPIPEKDGWSDWVKTSIDRCSVSEFVLFYIFVYQQIYKLFTSFYAMIIVVLGLKMILLFCFSPNGKESLRIRCILALARLVIVVLLEVDGPVIPLSILPYGCRFKALGKVFCIWSFERNLNTV